MNKMKKTETKWFLAAALFAALFALTLGACKSTPASGSGSGTGAGTASGASAPAGITDPSFPPWINDQPPEGELWGIGYADSATMSLRMTMADHRARLSLARQLDTLVKGMVRDYAREAGINNNTALRLQEEVSRGLTQARLTGAVPNQRWNTPDRKALWVRVKMSKDDAAANIQKAIDSEAARYAEFKAMEALKMMDQQLEKNPQSPQPVTE